MVLALIELAGRRVGQMRIHLSGARATDLVGSAQARRPAVEDGGDVLHTLSPTAPEAPGRVVQDPSALRK